MTDQKPDYLSLLAASGKVPGLTKPCPPCGGKGETSGGSEAVGKHEHGFKCQHCDGGTVPVDADRALSVLLDWCHAHEIGVAQSLSVQWRWEVKRHPTREWFYGATLAEAVARALGVVRNGE